MNKDKRRLLVMFIVLFLVVTTMILYSIMTVKNGAYSVGDVIAIILPFLIIVFMSILILSRYKDVKKGLPLEDERSKKVMNMASSRAFYVSLYWLLFISFFEDFFAGIAGLEKLDASQTVGGGIMGMAVLFIIFWFYYDRKGNLV
jgi:uncharacterized membrane protein